MHKCFAVLVGRYALHTQPIVLAQGHPHLPVIAASGIDNTIKVRWDEAVRGGGAVGGNGT